MSWMTAVSDLRELISDGATDKLAWQKKLLGITNGSNLAFKTFEKRRLTDFTSPSSPEGVFVNEAQVTVGSDDVDSGQVILKTAPVDGDRVTGTYYFQWFTDLQLVVYLKNASNFIGFGPDYTQIPDGLQPAALQYAAGDCYQELAVRFARMLSEGYRLEDLPKEALEATLKGYKDSSAASRKLATDLRKGFYTRQNQPDQAYSDNIAGRARLVEPNA